MLQALGLTATESQVYQLLVESGRCGIDRLGQLLGRPADRYLDEALTGLADKGLVTITDDRPAQLIPAPPDIAGETLLLLRMNELQSARSVLSHLTKEYRRVLGPTCLEEFAEIVPAETLAQRYEQLQRRARQEVLGFVTPPYLVGTDTDAVTFDQLTAGVQYRTVYDRAAIEQDGGQESIRRFLVAGERARVMSRLPVKLIIVDASAALLTLPAHAGRPPGAVVQIHQGPLLDALIALFELAWASALPLDPPSAEARGRAGLSGADVQLLTLLLSGLTDDAIARVMGIGKRTVNRRVRGLMDLAGASSRMQLGWQVSERGWLASSDVTGLEPADG